MKQQQHDINYEEDSEKKSESQIGFEPTTLRDLVTRSRRVVGSNPIWDLDFFFPSPPHN